MKALNVPRPHGFLIWRQKQKAIASHQILPTDEKMVIVSDGEAYGESILSQPVAVNLSEFEKMQKEHCIRPEERLLWWPDAESFYIHRLKEWTPYADMKEVQVIDGEVVFEDLPELTESQREIIKQAGRLPKTVILSDEAIVWTGNKAVIQPGIDEQKVNGLLESVLGKSELDAGQLSLYQLALIRNPRLSIKQEAMMPYRMMMHHDECDDEGKPVAVVNKQTGKLMGCHKDEESAMGQMRALMAQEKPKKKSADKPLAVFSDDKEMSLDQRVGKIREGFYRTFHHQEMAMPEEKERFWLREVYEDYVIVDANGKFYSVPYTEDGKVTFAPTSDWTEVEMTYQPKASKDYDDKAVTKSEGDGDHPASHYLVVEDSEKPTTWHLRVRNAGGEVDHRLMGAAWAALHGGYRGNKYQGPNKQEAIGKLTALYKREGLDTPGGEKDEKAGRRVGKSWREKLKDIYKALGDMMSWAEYADQHEEEDEEEKTLLGRGIGLKQVDGMTWFLSFSTNAFEDREREIFSTKSLENYVSQAEKGNDRGFFNFWHVPGSDFAKKEWQAVIGRILVEAGPFLDNELGQAAKEFFTEYSEGHPEIAPEGWGCSPEYRYLPEERKTGVYKNIWITRTSALPKFAAANVWTKGSVTMALTDQQKAALTKVFGEDAASKIISTAEQQTKELEEAGVSHKSNDDKPEVEDKAGKDLSIEDVVSLVAKQIQPDWTPFTEALVSLGEKMAEVSSRLDKLEKDESAKSAVETPRWLMQIKRASQAVETEVKEGDDLNEKKPKETRSDKSGAAHFFNN